MMRIGVIFFLYGVMWMSVAAAIIFAISRTNDMRCLWFFIIPALKEVHIQFDDKRGVEG